MRSKAAAILILLLVTQWALATETFDTKTDDDVIVYGYLYTEGLDRSAPLLLMYHQGQSNARGEYAQLAQWLNSEGFRVIAWDLRAGGSLYGSTNQTLRDVTTDKADGYCDAYLDVEAALRFTRSTGLAENVTVWGSSYSGALAFKLAAEHKSFVNGVIAFSPSTGNSVTGCHARNWVKDISVPRVVYRAASEMARESSTVQRDLFVAAGADYVVVDGGIHGSSALLDERTGADMQQYRADVLDRLRKIYRNKKVTD